MYPHLIDDSNIKIGLAAIDQLTKHDAFYNNDNNESTYTLSPISVKRLKAIKDL